MTDPSDRTESWSGRLEQRYRFRLPADLASWFDEECWRTGGPGEYCLPVSPEVLLADAPEPMWPPLMPPFFLPLVGSAAGDWLGLRLKGPPTTAEAIGGSADLPVVATDICQWYHGGGDWLPWGNTLSEALLFDGLLPRLPSAGRRHAEPAETSDSDSCQRTDAWLSHRWGRWAAERLNGRCAGGPNRSHLVGELFALEGETLVERLCQLGWCEVAARCQAIIHQLGSSVGRTIEPSMAARLGVSWNDLMRWCFDLREMPEEVAAKIVAWSESSRDTVSHPGAEGQLIRRVRSEQNWEAIERHAAAVSRRAPELAWGHELLGHVRFQAGDREAGRHHFDRALRCSVFTDQSVRLRTHWATSGAGRPAKFAAFFLESLSCSGDRADTAARADRSDAASGSGESAHENAGRTQIPPTGTDSLHRLPDSWPLSDYIGLLHGGDSSAVRRSVTRWFSELAEQATAGGQNEAAIVSLIAAGWDLGAEPINAYANLVDRLLQACRDAGWQPHAALMQSYRQCFQSRYGL